MHAVVTPVRDTISIDSRRPESRQRAVWSLLEVALPGQSRIPYAIILAPETGAVPAIRMRDLSCFESLEDDQIDILEFLPDDLAAKGRELGGVALLVSLEDNLSHFLRISDRTSIVFAGSAQAAADRLFDEHVDSRIRPFVSHLPFYTLRAAATKFGELMESEQEGWVRVPEKLRMSEGMFVAQVVGQSMEPRIPDGSLCVFRAPVVGSRQGRLVLIEQMNEYDIAWRYTIKRYGRLSPLVEGEERTEKIRLEPLNPEFEAFDLAADQFRVVAEFVQVLES